MARIRIPEWESRRALALYLYDHSPVTADYSGEMATKIARILDKTTDRVTPWQAGHALSIARSLEAAGHLAIEGDAKVTRVTWIGQTDPSIIDWEPPKPPAPERTDRVSRLEAQVAAMQAQIDRIPELVRQAVDIALEAWTK